MLGKSYSEMSCIKYHPCFTWTFSNCCFYCGRLARTPKFKIENAHHQKSKGTPCLNVEYWNKGKKTPAPELSVHSSTIHKTDKPKKLQYIYVQGERLHWVKQTICVWEMQIESFQDFHLLFSGVHHNIIIPSIYYSKHKINAQHNSNIDTVFAVSVFRLINFSNAKGLCCRSPFPSI